MSSNPQDKGCCDGRPIFPLVTQILSMALGFIAFVMTAAAVSGCSFVAPTGSEEFVYDTYGLFKFDSVIDCNENVCIRTCIKYTGELKNQASSSWKAAQAMGALSAAIGGITMATCVVMLFLKLPGWLFKTIGGCYIFCALTALLTLLALNDESCNGEAADLIKAVDPLYECGLGKDAVTAIIASIFYLAIGIVVLICPVPKTAVITCLGDCCKNCCDGDEGCGCCDDQSGNVVQGQPSVSGNKSVGSSTMHYETPSANASTVTETFNADGSVTIQEERINPDGSKSVTITTKPAASV